MSLVRLIARPMLASAYISNGLWRVRNSESSGEALKPFFKAAEKAVPVPFDAQTIARGAGIAQIGAGTLLAIGKFPRISATILAGTYLLDIVATSKEDTKTHEAQKHTRRKASENQRPSLLVRTSLLGGALLASVDTAGKPGLAWRAQHAAEDVWHNVEKTTGKALHSLNRN